MRRPLVALCLLLAVSACVTPPSDDSIRSADFGPPPTNPTAIAENWAKARMADPASARFEHDPVRRGWIRHLDTGHHFGWVQCGTVYGKTVFGTPGAPATYLIVVKNDKIEVGIYDSPSWPAAFGMCNHMRGTGVWPRTAGRA